MAGWSSQEKELLFCRSIALSAMVGLLILAVSGCGSGGNNTIIILPTQTPTPTPTPTATPTPVSPFSATGCLTSPRKPLGDAAGQRAGPDRGRHRR